MNILFSIIIPTYNRDTKLARCIDSLIKQTYKNFEILICDDGSTDSTKSVVNQYSEKCQNIRYFYNSNWGGPAYPRNVGISNARGHWLCFLDSDDWWYPTKLENILPYCMEGYDFIYHDFQLYKNNIKTTVKLQGRQLTTPAFEDLFVNDNCIVNSSVCVRKELIITAGGVSEDKQLIAVEDFDLWLRCARLTQKFKYVPKVLGAYDLGIDNITAQDSKQLIRNTILFERHKGFLGDPKLVKAAEINWSYKNGLIYFKMNNLSDAKEHFHVSRKSSNLNITIKSLYYIFKILLKKK